MPSRMEKKMERWVHIRPLSLVDIGDSAINKIWLPWPLATAHDIRELQPSMPKVKEGWKLRKRTRGRKWRGVKVWGSWGDAEYIFMSSRLSSFWVVWSHRHTFVVPHTPFLHLSFHRSSWLTEGPPMKSTQSSFSMFANFSPSLSTFISPLLSPF